MMPAAWSMKKRMGFVGIVAGTCVKLPHACKKLDIANAVTTPNNFVAGDLGARMPCLTRKFVGAEKA